MHAAVIGGGIAGLAAAWTLTRHGAGVRVFEASGRLGGQVCTRHVERFVVEDGADGFLLSDADGDLRALLDALDLAGRWVRPGQLRSLGWDAAAARLTALAPGEAARVLGLDTGPEQPGRGVATFPRGMGELVEALAGGLGPGAPCTGAAVVRLERGSGGWTIETTTGERHTAAGVVLAVPWTPAAALLGAPAMAAPRALSSVNVSLAYARDAVPHPLDASGFVVLGARRETPGLKACSFTSSRFPERAPAGWVALRAFYRPGPGCSLSDPDDRWIERAAAHVGRILGIVTPPARGWVARWPEALPQFEAKPPAAVAALEERVKSLGNIVLAGAAFHGVGVAAACRSGRLAARRLLAT